MNNWTMDEYNAVEAFIKIVKEEYLDLDVDYANEWVVRPKEIEDCFEIEIDDCENYILCKGINNAWRLALEIAQQDYDESIEWILSQAKKGKIESLYSAEKIIQSMQAALGESGKEKVVRLLLGMPAEEKDKNSENTKHKREVIAEFLARYDFKELHTKINGVDIFAYRNN